ncbi:Phosphatidylinositol 4-kinase alpha 1 [Vitis vinifera]|uniref:1-phosphatidylinositol 4-kinase n=1 Tax=Vitis vinifera TaxID=29760 RepID=A0A438JTR0_VITVI|nr:Phosphatidylinositol 4-kinase alpha 1 [Vitis vinifera]
MSHFVFPSPPYLPLLSLRMRGWRICGTQQSMGVNGFLASLDRVIGTVLKTRKFSVKSLHFALEPDDPLLSRGASFGVLVCHLRWLFCLGGDFGESLNFGSYPEEGVFLANGCFLCHLEEETVDPILLHCVKTRILWQLLFALFGVSWALPFSVKETLLGWLGVSDKVGKSVGEVLIWFAALFRKSAFDWKMNLHEVVSSVKWLEDELELNALHNPGSRRGSGNEKAAGAQRAALSAALAGRVEVTAMSTISGVKATYLLAVAFLEIIRFSSNGGILNGGGASLNASRSAFSCVFEYLKTPNLMPAVFQCLTAIVHTAFETAVSWLHEACVPKSGLAIDVSNGSGVTRGPSPFRFELMWMKDEGFKDLLKCWWEGYELSGRQVSSWSCTLSLEELSARNEAREEFKKWVLLEEISWRQKSREVWLKEGDKNTRFFHNMDNAHWKRNSLARIRINGSWITEDADIKNGAARLEEPFSEEEVFEALMDLSGEKGPGPDGFPMAFWQLSWEFVKVEGFCGIQILGLHKAKSLFLECTFFEDRISDTGNEAEIRESTLSAHACFLIKNMSQREEHIRDISVNLLSQLRERFLQVLWNSSCLDSLLFSVHDESPSALFNDPAWVATIRSLYQKVVREWIINSLSYAPCTSQGLLQEKLCKANTWQRAQHKPDVVSLLSEIRIGTGKNDSWIGTRTANVPAVIAAAAAASGANFKLIDAFNLEVLSTGIVSATVKCNHAGEIAGMRRFYDSIDGFQPGAAPTGFALGLQRLRSGVSHQPQPENESFNEILLNKFVRRLQQFVNIAEKGGEVNKLSFREICSQATALLLSNLGSDSKSNLEGSSQLLRLLCWCPAYISTPDAMETGVFIWTWLVSAAPQLGSLVLAELVDAWLWTIDTKRGLFASEARYSGPTAKLRPHLSPGEPEQLPEKDPVEQIIAHRLWLGFLIDRFEVVRHNSVEQLLLLGRMLQGTAKLPWKFSRHPAATGTFFTVMLLGLKFCSCQSQGNLQSFKTGLQLLEDRIYRVMGGLLEGEHRGKESAQLLYVHSQGILCITFEHQNWIGILATGMGQDVRLTGFCHQWVNFMWSFNEVPFRGVADILAINFCRLGGYARSGLLWEIQLESLSSYLQELNILLHAFDRASLGWFAYEPEWYDMNNINFAQSEAQSVSIFVHYLSNERVDTVQPESKKGVRENGSSLGDVKDQYHPVWGQMENYAAGREKRKQLLLMLCQHEADRLHVWAQPTNSSSSSRLKISSEKWIEFARTAFSVDPRIALSLASRFPTVPSLKAEVTQLVQLHIMELRCMPEALPYFVTPKAVDENSTLLQQLPHWAACSITQALEFLTPAYKGHPRVMAYVLRVLESYPPNRVTFFMPQLVQALRYDEGRLVEGYLLRAAQRSDIFAHILIWHLQGEQYGPELGKDAASAKNHIFSISPVFCFCSKLKLYPPRLHSFSLLSSKTDSPRAQLRSVDVAETPGFEEMNTWNFMEGLGIYSLLFQNSSFQALLPVVRQRIVDGFTPKALDLYNREFRFFDQVTSISGVLLPLPKEERPAGIRRELKKIQMEGEDLYLPTATTKLVKGIQVDSGITLQSAAKVPIMITFNVVDREGNHDDIKPQACIFKVGDDCRQDVLALQVISLLRDIFEAVGLNLYVFPYGVLPTGPGRGIIEVRLYMLHVMKMVFLSWMLSPCGGKSCIDPTSKPGVYGFLLPGISHPYLWLSTLINSPSSVSVNSHFYSHYSVVPNSRSRSQMGETTDGGLYEIFQQDFGPVGSPSFENARDNFIISSAGYAVASLILQPKDRHNGNLLFDKEGRLVHIDFGFILETSPGGNMRFESAHFKLSHEMTQLLDPSGVMKSETWYKFVSLCVKGYLAARRYMDGIVNTVLMMVDSGLPCFSRGDPIGNLRKRFHPEMSDREAANFMIRTCIDAYNKWTTAGYDLIQYLQQGIEQ